MRRYDEAIEVRRGLVQGVEAPEQFLWRGQLWRVGAIIAHWVETGPWWEHRDVHALLGVEETVDAPGPSTPSAAALLAECETWRVDASRGGLGRRGVFDLAFEWSGGRWRLTVCHD